MRNQLNQIKENKNSFEASFKPIWREIKPWGYLEFNNFQLIAQREISKRCFQKQPSEMFCKNRCS